MMYFEDKHDDLNDKQNPGFVGITLVGRNGAQDAVDVDYPREYGEVHDDPTMGQGVPDPEAEQHEGHIILCTVVQVGHCNYGDHQK